MNDPTGLYPLWSGRGLSGLFRLYRTSYSRAGTGLGLLFWIRPPILEGPALSK